MKILVQTLFYSNKLDNTIEKTIHRKGPEEDYYLYVLRTNRKNMFLIYDYILETFRGYNRSLSCDNNYQWPGIFEIDEECLSLLILTADEIY